MVRVRVSVRFRVKVGSTRERCGRRCVKLMGGGVEGAYQAEEGGAPPSPGKLDVRVRVRSRVRVRVGGYG